MNTPHTSTHTDETRLVQQAQAGDSHAFGELVLQHQNFVYNLALRALNNPEEAQDTAQEAFLRAWQALPNFRGQAQFSTWLYRITMNLCYDRRPRLKRELAALPIAEQENFADDQISPPGQVEASQWYEWIRKEVENLPESCRLLILLRYQKELSYEEISGILNMPLGTVKTGLFRAKAALKAALLARVKSREEVLEWMS